MTTKSNFIPSIDFKVWSSQLGTSDSFTDDLLKRLDSTIKSDMYTKSTTLTTGAISSSTISQGSLSTLDDGKTSKSLSIISSQFTTPTVYMEKTLEQSNQSFECFDIKVKEHDNPSTSAAAAAAAVAAAMAAAEAAEKGKKRSSSSSSSSSNKSSNKNNSSSIRKSTHASSLNEKSVLRKPSAYFSQTLRKIKSTPASREQSLRKKRPSSPGLIIKSKEKEEQERAFAKKPTQWWRKLRFFSRD